MEKTMRCWRIDLRRNLSRYLNESLSERAVKGFEDHLLDCGECRTRLARMRTGHRIARLAPFFKPGRDPWRAIEAAIERNEAEVPASQKWFEKLRNRFHSRPASRPALAVTVLAVIVASLSVSVLIKRPWLPGAQQVQWAEPPIDRGEFHFVNIADIESNTEPHVVAEGYVADVRIDDEDGDLRFKLVESLQQMEPFIVCEIIDPIKLMPPPVGSRVRVYGVSRYDGKLDHRWYEVHPVLSIEMLQHRD